jgi:hypothetical protein
MGPSLSRCAGEGKERALPTLSRYTGEGAERSEAGEGLPANAPFAAGT